jgi:hypothetical protein
MLFVEIAYKNQEDATDLYKGQWNYQHIIKKLK